MQYSLVGIVGVPASYGGFESLAENLIPSSNIKLIYCSAKGVEGRLNQYKGTALMYFPISANGWQSIIYDALCILHSLFFTKNSLLVLGVSGAFMFPLFKAASGRKIVVNIDGMEWRREKWGRTAKAFLKWCESLAVRTADVVIADNRAIAEYVFEEYGVTACTIPYGGDHAVVARGETICAENAGYTLGLCRIEPENNVELILRAFSRVPERKLKFIGNWGNSDFGRRLRAEYSACQNIELLDPVYDLNELFEVRVMADSYVHGHSAGGTNPSLVEMMFFELPIYCFDCAFNRYTTHEEALFFSSEDALIELLTRNGREVNPAMIELAKKEYTWKSVKNAYAKVM